jgi:hypothetical protein
MLASVAKKEPKERPGPMPCFRMPSVPLRVRARAMTPSGTTVSGWAIPSPLLHR